MVDIYRAGIATRVIVVVCVVATGQVLVVALAVVWGALVVLVSVVFAEVAAEAGAVCVAGGIVLSGEEIGHAI
jgi:hypothetical protein